MKGMDREQTTIRLPAELKEKLQQEADKRGITMRDMVLIILNLYFENIAPK